MSNLLYEFMHACRSEDGGWSVEGVETGLVVVSGDSVTVDCSSPHLSTFACFVDLTGNYVRRHLVEFLRNSALTHHNNYIN